MIKISNYNFLRIEDAKYHRLLIGKTGENEYRSFCFDISKWLKKYPDGFVAAIFKRPDGVTYPVAVKLSGNVVTWTVTATELAVSGRGELELQIHSGEVIGKSASIVTVSDSALEPTAVPTEPQLNWIEDIVNQTSQAINSANQAAINAFNAAASVKNGKDGLTPHIGANGNWYVGNEDTGVKALGKDGVPGANGKDGAPGAVGANGKSAYEYALEGGYSGTEEDFSLKLAQDNGAKAFYVTVTENSDGTKTADKTVAEIEAAYQEGRPLFCWYNTNSDWNSLPLRERVAEMIWSFSAITNECITITVTFFGTFISTAITPLATKAEIPTKLSQLTNDIEVSTEDTSAFYLNLTANSNSTFTPDKTIAEIEEAYQAGRPLFCICPLPEYNQSFCLPFASRVENGEIWMFAASAMKQSLVVTDFNNSITVSLTEMAGTDDIPSALPNPSTLYVNNDKLNNVVSEYNGNRNIHIIIPTKLSTLENDADYATNSSIGQTVTDKVENMVPDAVKQALDNSINDLVEDSVQKVVPGAVQDALGDSIYSLVDESVQNVIENLEEYEDFIIAEAERVAKTVLSKQNENTLSFIACSDIHHSTVNANKQQLLESLKHAGDGMELLSSMIHIDFAAMLGDLVWNEGETDDEALQAMREVNSALHNGFSSMPNLRLVGEHDSLYSSSSVLGGSYIFANTSAYNSGAVFDVSNRIGGYCYRDFDDRKIRVVCLNTAEGLDGTFGISDSQASWIEKALDVSQKGRGWRVVLLSHHPLDWAGDDTEIMSKIKASSDILCAFHGHTHSNTVGTISGTDIPQIAIPNMCFYRNNEYSEQTEYADPSAYNKIADTADDTAFCVVTIDPVNGKAYIDRYGAGVDRETQINTRFINLVPTSRTYNNTAVYGSGLGYRNGRYVATSPGSSDGANADVVATGYISIPETGIDAIYVKGVTLDTSNSYNRFMTYLADYNIYKYVQGNAYVQDNLWESYVTIETLGTKYYKLTPLEGFFGEEAVFFRLSLTGTGENFIITINDPIE